MMISTERCVGYGMIITMDWMGWMDVMLFL